MNFIYETILFERLSHFFIFELCVPTFCARKVVFCYVGADDVPVSSTSLGTDAVQFVSNINPSGLKSSQSASVSANQKPTQTPPKSE